MEFVKTRKGKSETDALSSNRLLALLEDGEKEIYAIKALIEKLQGRNYSVGMQMRIFLLLFNCS